MFLFGLCVGILAATVMSSILLLMSLISWIFQDIPPEKELQDFTLIHSIYWENASEQD